MARVCLRTRTHLCAVRSVEFVVRPGATERLREVIREAVAPLLAQESGFEGVIVMVSEREPRLVSVSCFWREKPSRVGSQWEQIPSIRNVLEPLIDWWRGTCTSEASMFFPGFFSAESDDVQLRQ